LESAYSWILAASLAGDQRGQEYLAQLEKQLTSEQIALAEQRAATLREDTVRTATELAFVY
jgi:hypothetical protein